MAGIQVSGLLSNQAFDWKSVVDQLIAVDSIPIQTLQKQKSDNADKVAALAEVNTALEALQDSVQSIRSGNIFQGRNVTSDVANTSWRSSSAAGAPVGTYKFAVSQLATPATLSGSTDIGSGLGTASDGSDITLASMHTATAVTAGVFTIAGQQITVALTDSLKDVFDKIATATGNTVTGSYDAATDKVTLSQSSGELLIGAGNDTSNFLQVLKLNNTGLGSTTSAGALGVLKTSDTLVNAGLRTAVTAVDGTGAGTFSINNVAISYNVNTDSLSSVLDRINKSTAGVTATYDAAADRVVLTNKNTGDVGVTVSEASGGLLGALGLTSGATLTHGKNAIFTVNDGPPITSASNTLDATVHGITGLSVTINSQTTQTLTVESDAAAMQQSIQNVLDKFNAVQDKIEEKTKVSIGGGNVSTSILSDNREIQSWARNLQEVAFNAISGLTGSVKSIDDLGIDFDGTTGHLTIKNQGKLTTALSDHPDDVQSYFVSGSIGLVPKMYEVLSNYTIGTGGVLSQQDAFNKSSAKIDEQITTLQARLDSERESLTQSFIRMLDAQSAAQSQNQSLTQTFFKNNNN
jgi:flagellar hook-associated protein 2